MDQIEELMRQQRYEEAIRVLARSLPKPAAVAWACRCIRAVLPSMPETAARALASAERWANDPSEEHRQAAKVAADAAGLEHPAGVAALAAFYSGPSLAPPNLPAVPPAEHLAGQAAAGAILLAAVFQTPDMAAEKQRRFLTLGLQAANPTKVAMS